MPDIHDYLDDLKESEGCEAKSCHLKRETCVHYQDGSCIRYDESTCADCDEYYYMERSDES